jgi:hypothetical protein
MRDVRTGSTAGPPARGSSDVRSAKGRKDRKSFAELLSCRQALLAHLRAKFAFSEDEAADALQDFLYEKVLVGKLLAAADPKRGRFLTFVLNALDNYTISRHRQRNTRKRRPPGHLVSLQDVTEDSLPAHVDEHDHRTEVIWSQAVIAGALLNMHAELRKRGRKDVWAVFEHRILQPLLDDRPPVSYERLVRDHGYVSPAEAFNVLVTAKRMFKRHLRAVIAEYALDDKALEEELAFLKRMLED